MRLQYRLVNVFTRDGGRLTGNPLCVFDDARGLSDGQMQALALQFNLSETTFILPSDRADARVRIFTPGYEMPFAGHPTLGTAHVLRSLGNLPDTVTLELNVGVIPVSAADDRWEFRAPTPTTRAPRACASDLANAFALDPGDVAAAALWVNAGSEQLIVPLASAGAVSRASVTWDALAGVTADGPRPQACIFAEHGAGELVSRFFFSKAGSVLEDPATGSAAANLGGWLLAQGASLPLTRSISQGEQTGRPSTLQLRIDRQGNVFVAGEVVELGGGYVEL